MEGVSARGAMLKMASFQKTSARTIDLTQSDLSLSQWRQSDCEGANFTDSNLSFGDFSHANLKNSLFGGAILNRTNFHRALEEGADYSGSSRPLGRETDPELQEAEDFVPRNSP